MLVEFDSEKKRKVYENIESLMQENKKEKEIDTLYFHGDLRNFEIELGNKYDFLLSRKYTDYKENDVSIVDDIEKMIFKVSEDKYIIIENQKKAKIETNEKEMLSKIKSCNENETLDEIKEMQAPTTDVYDVEHSFEFVRDGNFQKLTEEVVEMSTSDLLPKEIVNLKEVFGLEERKNLKNEGEKDMNFDCFGAPEFELDIDEDGKLVIINECLDGNCIKTNAEEYVKNLVNKGSPEAIVNLYNSMGYNLEFVGEDEKIAELARICDEYVYEILDPKNSRNDNDAIIKFAGPIDFHFSLDVDFMYDLYNKLSEEEKIKAFEETINIIPEFDTETDIGNEYLPALFTSMSEETLEYMIEKYEMDKKSVYEKRHETAEQIIKIKDEKIEDNSKTIEDKKETVNSLKWKEKLAEQESTLSAQEQEIADLDNQINNLKQNQK